MQMNKIWQVKTNDMFFVGDHRLLCGDSTKVENVGRVVCKEEIGAMVTDPPFGIANKGGMVNNDPKELRELFNNCLSSAPIKNTIIITFQSPSLFYIWFDACRDHNIEFGRLMWMHNTVKSAMVWHGWRVVGNLIQISKIGKPEWGKPLRHEYDCYIKNKKDDSGFGALHVTMKPLSIVEDLVSHTTGDIYDPFLGSGTTMVAAENLGRRCLGIEIVPQYVAGCLRRMNYMFPGINIRKEE